MRFLLIVLFFAFSPGLREAYGGSIASVDPKGASADVIVDITGAGFDPAASNNRVVFTREGISAENRAVIASTLDSKAGLRRIGVPMPEGLPAGTAQVKVVNMTTGEVIDGASIEVIGITLVDASAEPGSSVDIRITGTPNAKFVPGWTVAAFGDGVRVNSETIESATSIVANITVAPDAAAGTRSIGLMTESQVAVLLRAFTVKEASPVLAVSDDGKDPFGIDMASIDDIFVDDDNGVKFAAASGGDTAAKPTEPEAKAVEVKKAANDVKLEEIKAELASGPDEGAVRAATPGPAAQPAKAAKDAAEPVKIASAMQTAKAVDAASPETPAKPVASSLRSSRARENRPEPAKEPGKAALKTEKAADAGAVRVNNSATPDTAAPPALNPNEEISVKAENAGAEPAKKDLFAGSLISGQTAEITVKDLAAPKTIDPPAEADATESGLLRKLLVAFLGPFVLIWYLISHIWK